MNPLTSLRRSYDTLRSVVRFERIQLDPVERRLARAASVADLRRIARRRLPGGVFDYIDGGAEDERTLAANESAFAGVGYRPRVLRGIDHVDIGSSILGQPVAYPLARGSGALLAAVGGVALLDDHLGGWSWLAIAVVVAGIVLLVGQEVHPAAAAWGLATGVTIGTYTLVDSAGSRETEGLPYGLTLMVATASTLSAYNLGRGRLRSFRALLPTAWRRWLVGGACTTTAYTLVLIAVRYAPVGYVATLRESSVLIAALLGWLVLKEPLGERRTAAAAVMTAGLVLLVISRP